ncbi:MAG: hypothetical protein ACE5F1_06210, partial [Planctomycetota bacterium]
GRIQRGILPESHFASGVRGSGAPSDAQSLIPSLWRMEPSFRRFYIDQNPVGAGIVDLASEYPFGSARAHYSESWPPWLARSWLEEELADDLRLGMSWAEAYHAAFGAQLSRAEIEVVKRRMARRDPCPSRGHDLIGTQGERVRLWMQQCAAQADGTSAGALIASSGAVSRAVRSTKASSPAVPKIPVLGRFETWKTIQVALLRDTCGMTHLEIATRQSMGESSVRRRLVAHRAAMLRSKTYAQLATQVGELAIRISAGGR